MTNDTSCGWVICEYHSLHDDDSAYISGYCMRKEGKCECGIRPEIVWEQLIEKKESEVEK